MPRHQKGAHVLARTCRNTHLVRMVRVCFVLHVCTHVANTQASKKLASDGNRNSTTAGLPHTMLAD